MVNALIVTFIAIFLVLLVRVYLSTYPGKEYNHVKFMTRIGIFSAISTILYIVKVFTIKLPFFPSFLELHFDEIPAFIAGFAYGPWAGLAVIAVKTIIKLPFTNPMAPFVGEVCDLILSSVYVFIVTFIYKKARTLKGVAIGFAIGTVVQIVVAMILNVYVMIPFYINVAGLTEESLLIVMNAAMPAIKDIGWSYALIAVLPFNALKDLIVIIITFIVYRSLHIQLRFVRN